MKIVHLICTVTMAVIILVINNIVYCIEKEDSNMTVSELYEKVLHETKYKEAGFVSKAIGGSWSVALFKEGNCWQLCDYFRKELIANGVDKSRIKYVKLYKNNKYVHCMLMVDDIVYELSEINREIVWYKEDSLLELRNEFDYYKLK